MAFEFTVTFIPRDWAVVDVDGYYMGTTETAKYIQSGIDTNYVGDFRKTEIQVVFSFEDALGIPAFQTNGKIKVKVNDRGFNVFLRKKVEDRRVVWEFDQEKMIDAWKQAGCPFKWAI